MTNRPRAKGTRGENEASTPHLLTECGCGCGDLFAPNKSGRPQRFATGHRRNNPWVWIKKPCCGEPKKVRPQHARRAETTKCISCANKEKHPQIVDGICEFCGRRFSRRASTRFCNKRCAGTYRVEMESFGCLRREIWERHDYTCDACRRVVDRPQIHHRIGRDLPNSNAPENLVPLCASCHARVTRWADILTVAEPLAGRLHKLAKERAAHVQPK